ncbi:FAD-dependent oxidoreductase [Candidatus Uhrbacteria bacterium]|nr:FAD-dependent oxidoreductase [Candidatus Uhrbacteria bacterium]
MAEAMHDVVVIGAGPAGLAAAMFAARRGLKTVIVSKDLGGQLALTEWIENYPGVDRAGGRELCERFLAQAKRDGAEFRLVEAIGIEPSPPRPPSKEGGKQKSISPPPSGRGSERGWVVRLAEGDAITTKTIILAFGLTPNDLGCEGEQRLKGKGVYYSAVDDAPKQNGKTVAVVGGGNSAVTAVLELASRAAKVLLIHRRIELRAEKALLERMRALSNVEVLTPYTVAALTGEDHVRAIVLAHAEAGENKNFSPSHRVGEFAGVGTRRLTVDSVFVQIGYSAKTKWLEGAVQLNEKREVIVDRDCRTSASGIFAAGDLTDIAYKQAAISVGEGVKAALQVFKYLQGIAGKPAVLFDWDVRGKL